MNNNSLLKSTAFNILIVDDEPVAVSFLVSLLKEQGYKVRVAINAQLAFETVKIKAPDLILLDVNLPDMDGFEVCQRLKASAQYRQISVIFVSALHDTVDKVKGFQVGGIDYISKPFAPQEVLARVKTHLTVRFMQEQLEHRNAQLEQEIIARQRSEAALQKAHEELEQRVEERTQALAKVNQALQQQIEEQKQTERELRISDEILKQMPDAILFTDLNGNIQRWMGRAEQILGYTAAEAIGKPMSVFHTPEFQKSESARIVHEINETGQLFYEIPCVKKEGTIVPIETTAAMIFDNEGEPLGLIGINRDISERKRSEEILRDSEARFRTQISNIPGIIYRCANDKHWTMEYISGEVDKISGYPATDFIHNKNRSYVSIIHGDDQNRVYQAVQDGVNYKRPYTIEYRLIHKDGRIKWVFEKGRGIFDPKGKLLWLDGLIFDITDRKRAEEALREHSERQKALLDSIPAFVYFKDRQLNYLAANKALAEMLGIGVNEFAGKTDYDFFPKADAEFYRKYDGKVMESGEAIYNFEESYVNPEGQTRWVLTTKIPYRNAEGVIIGMVGTTLDITERKRIEEALQRSAETFKKFFESSAVGIALIPLEVGNIGVGKETLNMSHSAMQTFFGYSETELQAKTGSEFSNPENMNQDIEHFNALLVGKIESYCMEKPFIRKDWGNLSVALLRDDEDKPTHIISTIQDITERKRTEEALRQAKEAAESANHAKSEFLANMSHEIRTPMNAIIGLTRLALKTVLTNKQRDYLTQIEASSQVLLNIINDILDFSKIEAGKLSMEAVNFHLDDVLDNLSNLLGVKIAEKNLELLMATGLDVPRYLVGDPLRLGQILINLTSNAIKFTEQGTIVVKTELVKRENEQIRLRFSVQDTGIGISPSVIPFLFDAFTQADGSTTRKFGGSGLGLAICKRLVKMMGGDIQVESQPGQGSIFSFTVVLGCQADQTETIFQPPLDMQGLRVLVVDDNETSCEILQEELSAFSFEVFSVSSGEAALTELANALLPYDLVLLDWHLPQMDGIETAIRINQALASQPHKIIMVTAFSRSVALKKADKTCLNAFLTKPVLPATLFDTIMEVFGKDVAKTSRQVHQKVTLNHEAMPTFHGARILLVEDNAINQQVAQEILTCAGLVVEMANNGQEAVAAMKTNSDNTTYFKAVLMDIQMPEMDGYEATRLIREQPQYDKLPIIAMTAHAMSGDREKCLAAGMNDYVSKPIEEEQLLTVLGKWIKIRPQITSYPDAQPSKGKETKAAVETWLEELSGIDIKKALKRLQNNRKLFKTLLKDFYRDYQNIAHDIQMALDKSDLQQAVHLSHTLKGVAGNLAAHQLQQAAHRLENALNQGHLDNIKGLMAQLENALAHVFKQLNRLEWKLETSEMEQIKPAVDRLFDKATVAPLLIELAEFINRNSANASKSLAVLKESLKGTRLTNELKQLEKCLDIFDFQGAQIPLNAIANALGLGLKSPEANSTL